MLHVTDHKGWAVAGSIRKSGLSLFVLRLSVDQDSVTRLSVAAGGFPDFFHEHTGGVVGTEGDAPSDEASFVLVGRTESGDDDDIILGELIPKGVRVVLTAGDGAVATQRKPFVGLEVTETPCE